MSYTTFARKILSSSFLIAFAIVSTNTLAYTGNADPFLSPLSITFRHANVISDKGVTEVDEPLQVDVVVAAKCSYEFIGIDEDGFEYVYHTQVNYIGYVVDQEKTSTVFLEGEEYMGDVEWINMHMTFVDPRTPVGAGKGGKIAAKQKFDIWFDANLTDEGLVGLPTGTISTAFSTKAVNSNVLVVQTGTGQQPSDEVVAELCGYNDTYGAYYAPYTPYYPSAKGLTK